MIEQTDYRNPPFFIVGAQRSGTTMLRLMLNSHPNLAIPYESDFIPSFYQKLSGYGDLSLRDNVAKLLKAISENPHVKKGSLIQDSEAVLSYSIRSYADLVNAIFTAYAKREGKKRWGDKTPGYVAKLDIIWKLFPGCRIVHLVRDGRDVAISLRGLDWGSKHIPTVAEDWRWKTTLGHKIGSVLGEYYLEVHYEDLVLKTEDTLRTICAFLQEPYHKEMLNFYSAAEKEMPKESLKWHKSSVRPPDSNKVYMWKREMSLSDRIIFEQIAGETLELFGYETEQHPSTLSSRLKNLYYCLVKRW
jgi:hypothetical protein